jgi:hypothetical protein
MRGRFIIEGEWSGYSSSQRRVVHRKVYKNRPMLRTWATKAGAIRYTDGTCLVLRVRDLKPRERVAEINGYTKLIEDCAHHNVTNVASLP